jgi:hypothetical protein
MKRSLHDATRGRVGGEPVHGDGRSMNERAPPSCERVRGRVRIAPVSPGHEEVAGMAWTILGQTSSAISSMERCDSAGSTQSWPV